LEGINKLTADKFEKESHFEASKARNYLLNLYVKTFTDQICNESEPQNSTYKFDVQT